MVVGCCIKIQYDFVALIRIELCINWQILMLGFRLYSWHNPITIEHKGVLVLKLINCMYTSYVYV